MVMRLLGTSRPPWDRNTMWCNAGYSTHWPHTRQHCPSRSITASRTSAATRPSRSSSISERRSRFTPPTLGGTSMTDPTRQDIINGLAKFQGQDPRPNLDWMDAEMIEALNVMVSIAFENLWPADDRRHIDQ